MRAVLFDLDGTLHDRAATIRQWLEGHTRRFDLPAGYVSRFVELDDFGYRPKQEILPLLVQEFGLEHDAGTLCEDFIAHAFSVPVLMRHSQEMLRELRGRGVLIGVVTNGRTIKQRQTLTELNFGALVDDLVISEEVGLSKPDGAIYRLALERLGAQAGDAWFVGDSPRNDVWGPQQIGLRSAFLNTGHALGQERPDAVLDDLRGVLELA